MEWYFCGMYHICADRVGEKLTIQILAVFEAFLVLCNLAELICEMLFLKLFAPLCQWFTMLFCPECFQNTVLSLEIRSWNWHNIEACQRSQKGLFTEIWSVADWLRKLLKVFFHWCYLQTPSKTLQHSCILKLLANTSATRILVLVIELAYGILCTYCMRPKVLHTPRWIQEADLPTSESYLLPVTLILTCNKMWIATLYMLISFSCRLFTLWINCQPLRG